jgi:hypothetical protein
MNGVAMNLAVTLMDCPAFLDEDGLIRCALPAEVQYRYAAGSTGGPLDSAKIRCPRGHWFNATIDVLTQPMHGGHRAGVGIPAARTAR